MMQLKRMLAGSVLAAALVMVASASAVGGEEKHSADDASSEGSTLSMSKFWSSETGRTGVFPGRLVCLRGDLKPGPDAMRQCEKAGHRHALSMDSDSMI